MRDGVGRVPTIRLSREWGGRGPIRGMERVVLQRVLQANGLIDFVRVTDA